MGVKLSVQAWEEFQRKWSLCASSPKDPDSSLLTRTTTEEAHGHLGKLGGLRHYTLHFFFKRIRQKSISRIMSSRYCGQVERKDLRGERQ